MSRMAGEECYVFEDRFPDRNHGGESDATDDVFIARSSAEPSRMSNRRPELSSTRRDAGTEGDSARGNGFDRQRTAPSSNVFARGTSELVSEQAEGLDRAGHVTDSIIQ